MMTDHLAQMMERLSQAPAPVQEQYATLIEAGLEQEVAQEQSATPPVYASTLDLAGIITDPSVKPLTAREIDDLLAEEAGSTHHAEAS